MPSPIYSDRADAGQRLAARLESVRGEHPVIVGIVPHGVLVAYAAAVALDAPLEAWAPRPLEAPRMPLRNETVVVVDEGVATGATVLAAIRDLRQEKPHRIVVAVPIAVRGALDHVEAYADGLVCLAECDELPGLRAAYAVFDPTGDDAYEALVEQRRHERAGRVRPSKPPHR